MRIIALVLLTFPLLGCVSAYMDHYSGKYRNVFIEGATIESIRDAVGEPEYTFIKDITQDQPKYNIDVFHSYDVFDVKGKIHKPGDGSVQTMLSAVTFGIGELILIPYTAVAIAGDYTKIHTLVVFYNENNGYLEHQLYDSDGNSESVLGY